MSVIVGTGKPRIAVDYGDRDTFEFTYATSTLTLVTTNNLSELELSKGLINRVITAKNSTGEDTRVRITGYDNTTKILTVDAWTNGVPSHAVQNTLQISIFWLDLPYCQSLVERFSPDFISRKLYSGNISILRRGWYYSATLSYDRYVKKDMLLLLNRIYRVNAPDELWFYPRRDNGQIVYKVQLDPKYTTEIAQRPHHYGHLLFNLELMGIERVSQLPFTDTASVGYGDNYGGDYGDYL